MRQRRLRLLVWIASAVLAVAGAGWLILWPPAFVTSAVGSAPLTPSASSPTVELDRFAARQDASDGQKHTTIFMRLRTNVEQGLPCFVFLVASNDHASPKTFAVWPPQSAGLAVTATGHFHGASPTSGYAITLTTSWQRITATLPDPPNGDPFDLVVVYVVNESGGVLISRPFRP